MGVTTGPFRRKDLSSPSARLTGMRGTVSRASAAAPLGSALGRDLGDADWSRLLDVLLLVAAHPVDA